MKRHFIDPRSKTALRLFLEIDRQTTSGEGDMNESRVFEIITRHAREVVPGLQAHNFQPSDSLKDLGANSVDRSEIVMMTLESLSLKIPLVETARAANIGELVNILNAKL